MDTDLLDILRRHLAEHTAVKAAVSKRYHDSLGKALKALRIGTGFTQLELFNKLHDREAPKSRPDCDQDRRNCDQVRRWEKSQIPKRPMLENYIRVGKAFLQEGARKDDTGDDVAKVRLAVQVVEHFVERFPTPLEKPHVLRGRLELRLPGLPDARFEDIEHDEDTVQTVRYAWFEHSPIKVYSGGQYLGNVSEEGLTIGKRLTIWATEEGLCIGFPVDQNVEGLHDPWEVIRQSGDRRRRSRAKEATD